MKESEKDIKWLKIVAEKDELIARLKANVLNGRKQSDWILSQSAYIQELKAEIKRLRDTKRITRILKNRIACYPYPFAVKPRTENQKSDTERKEYCIKDREMVILAKEIAEEDK